MSIITSAFYRSNSWIDQHRLPLRRILIISGVLAVSLLSGPLSSTPLPLLVTGILLFVGFIVTMVFYPQLTPLVLIFTGLLAPRGPSDNFNPTVLMLVLLTGLWMLHMVSRRQVFGYFDGIPVRPALVLVGAAVLALAIGQFRWYSLEPAPLESQFGGLAIFVLSASAFLMVAYYIRDLRWLQWMVWLFLILAGAYIVARILPDPFRRAINLFPWGSTSTLFWIWLVAHLSGQILLNRDLKAGTRLGLAALLIAALYAAWFQTFDWKSGWIPPLVAMGTIIVLRWPKFGIVFVAVVAVASPRVISALVSGDAYSYSSRVDAWRTMAEVIKANPITGLGPSNYYWYTPLFEISGYNVSFSSHNQYVDLIAQTGIVGLVAYLWFFLKVGLIGWRVKHIAPAGFARAYVYSSLGGLAAMMVAGLLGDWVLPFVYNVGMVGMRSSILGWLYLGGLVALARMLDNSHAPRNNDTSAHAFHSQPAVTRTGGYSPYQTTQ